MCPSQCDRARDHFRATPLRHCCLRIARNHRPKPSVVCLKPTVKPLRQPIHRIKLNRPNKRRRLIPLPLQRLRQKRHGRCQRPPNLGQAHTLRIRSGQYRGMRDNGSRRLRISVLKTNALPSESVQVGRGRPLRPEEPHAVSPRGIDGDKHKVRLRRGFGGYGKCDTQAKQSQSGTGEFSDHASKCKTSRADRKTGNRSSAPSSRAGSACREVTGKWYPHPMCIRLDVLGTRRRIIDTCSSCRSVVRRTELPRHPEPSRRLDAAYVMLDKTKDKTKSD